MRSKLALALAAAALLAACAQSPTASAPSRTPAALFDNGGMLGSGGATGTSDGGSSTAGTTTVAPGDSANGERGGNTLGSGH